MKMGLAGIVAFASVMTLAGCIGLRDKEVLLDLCETSITELPEPRHDKWVEETVEEEVQVIGYRLVEKEVPYETYRIVEEQVPFQTWTKVDTWVPCKVWETYTTDHPWKRETKRVPVTDNRLRWEKDLSMEDRAKVERRLAYEEFEDVAHVESDLTCRQCVAANPCGDCQEVVELNLRRIVGIPVRRIRPKIVEQATNTRVMSDDDKPMMVEEEHLRRAWGRPKQITSRRAVDGRRLVVQKVMVEKMKTVERKEPVTEMRMVEVCEPYEKTMTVERTIRRRVPSPGCEDIPCPPKPEVVRFQDPHTCKEVVCDPCVDGGMCKIDGVPYHQPADAEVAGKVGRLVPARSGGSATRAAPAPEAGGTPDAEPELNEEQEDAISTLLDMELPSTMR